MDILQLLANMLWLVVAIAVGFPLTVSVGFALGMLAGFLIKCYLSERKKNEESL